MASPPKTYGVVQREKLERENALLRKLAFDLKWAIDSMQRTLKAKSNISDKDAGHSWKN
jgi:hypothetical protein